MALLYIVTIIVPYWFIVRFPGTITTTIAVYLGIWGEWRVAENQTEIVSRLFRFFNVFIFVTTSNTMLNSNHHLEIAHKIFRKHQNF
jgi:hypothetical protein